MIKILKYPTYNRIIISAPNNKMVDLDPSNQIFWEHGGFSVPNNRSSQSVLNQMMKIQFRKTVSVVGVGYKISIIENTIVLDVGVCFKVNIPANLTVISVNPSTIVISGNSSLLVCNFSASIVNLHPAYKDVYKHKGIIAN